jgi:hypothetical protein
MVAKRRVISSFFGNVVIGCLQRETQNKYIFAISIIGIFMLDKSPVL